MGLRDALGVVGGSQFRTYGWLSLTEFLIDQISGFCFFFMLLELLWRLHFARGTTVRIKKRRRRANLKLQFCYIAIVSLNFGSVGKLQLGTQWFHDFAVNPDAAMTARQRWLLFGGLFCSYATGTAGNIIGMYSNYRHFLVAMSPDANAINRSWARIIAVVSSAVNFVYYFVVFVFGVATDTYISHSGFLLYIQLLAAPYIALGIAYLMIFATYTMTLFRQIQSIRHSKMQRRLINIIRGQFVGTALANFPVLILHFVAFATFPTETFFIVFAGLTQFMATMVGVFLALLNLYKTFQKRFLKTKPAARTNNTTLANSSQSGADHGPVSVHGQSSIAPSVQGAFLFGGKNISKIAPSSRASLTLTRMNSRSSLNGKNSAHSTNIY